MIDFFFVCGSMNETQTRFFNRSAESNIVIFSFVAAFIFEFLDEFEDRVRAGTNERQVHVVPALHRWPHLK